MSDRMESAICARGALWNDSNTKIVSAKIEIG